MRRWIIYGIRYLLKTKSCFHSILKPWIWQIMLPLLHWVHVFTCWTMMSIHCLKHEKGLRGNSFFIMVNRITKSLSHLFCLIGLGYPQMRLYVVQVKCHVCWPFSLAISRISIPNKLHSKFINKNYSLFRTLWMTLPRGVIWHFGTVLLEDVSKASIERNFLFQTSY